MGWQRVRRQAIEDLHPASFAVVMSTGICSLAAAFTGHAAVGWALFYLNILCYGGLWGLTLLRLVLHSRRLWADFSSARSFGYLTTVAGTCVLGTQFVNLQQDQRMASLLWVLGAVLWSGLLYGFFLQLITRRHKPGADADIHGGWLLAIVATQSLSTLGTLIAPSWDGEGFRLLTLALWLAGCMLYLLLMPMILHRLLFFPVQAESLTPLYWINMGAIAISTLAGDLLILHARSPWLQELLPFLKGFTLFFWSGATWWIPLLIALGAWRHLYLHYPLSYSIQYWGMVFPLGMYTVCTFQLGRALDMPPLIRLAGVGFYIAIAAWLATALGGMGHLVRLLATPGARNPGAS
ncbi:MAG TPA: tellurite resistance/C4-dicarboxylate transporter family protein [Stenomitos sp.]